MKSLKHSKSENGKTTEFTTDYYPELKGLVRGLKCPIEIKVSMLNMAAALDFAYENDGDTYYQNVMKSIISTLKGGMP